MEKPDLGTIFTNLLRVEKVLWLGSAEVSISLCTRSPDLIHFRWLLILWVVSVSQAPCIHGKWDYCLLSNNSSSTVIVQVLLFCIRKVVTQRHFHKFFNIHNFLSEERQAMDEHQISDQSSRSALICLHNKRERYIMFSNSDCWTVLGNLMNLFFFSIWTCMSE